MGRQRAAHSEVADAPIEACFDAACDYEAFPGWSSSVRSVQVRSRDGDGRGEEVEFVTDAKVRTIRYVLRYRYDPPHRIAWDYVEGDAKSVQGDYEFAAEAGGGTRITYRLDIDPGAFVPGPVKKMLVDHVMRTSVRDLKRHVESR